VQRFPAVNWGLDMVGDGLAKKEAMEKKRVSADQAGTTGGTVLYRPEDLQS